jgi:tRNA(Arg) A34 adenosine deaminase TadA
VAIDEAHEWCAKNGRNFDEVGSHKGIPNLWFSLLKFSPKIMRQTVVYVNLEPCIMCASALYQIKIAKLVFGAKNPRFGGIESVASNQSYGHEHEIQVDISDK